MTGDIAQPMATQPLVTIVCIFLDEERFLREAIESVVAQDFANWELILVDDGSRDASGDIAAGFAAAEPRIRAIHHPGHANRGMSASRNAGVAAGSGRYVTFIDGDDCWPEGKLTEQLAVMQAHPQIAAVFGSYRLWESWRGGEDSDTHCGVKLDCVTYPPAGLLDVYPLGPDGGGAVNVLFTREIFDRVGGFEESFTGFYEDQAFFVKVYAHAPVWFSSEIWQYYRQHTDSCCARVAADGTYTSERGKLLAWLEPYVRSLDTPWRAEALAVVEREKRVLRRKRLINPVKSRLASIRRKVTPG